MMPVVILFGLLGIVVVAATFLLATNRWRDPGLVDDPGDRVPPPVTDVPLGQLQPQDLDDLRLDVSARGYRMDEVDAVIARLTAEIAARDAAATDTGDAPGPADTPDVSKESAGEEPLPEASVPVDPSSQGSPASGSAPGDDSATS